MCVWKMTPRMHRRKEGGKGSPSERARSSRADFYDLARRCDARIVRRESSPRRGADLRSHRIRTTAREDDEKGVKSKT